MRQCLFRMNKRYKKKIQLCVNSNKSAIRNLSVTHYISYESSISQLSRGDMFYIQLRLCDKIWGQKDCHSAGTFSRSKAGLTSQIRLL